MAAGDWAAGTKVVLLDVTMQFDGTAANVPTMVRVGYRIHLPSGVAATETRSLAFTPDVTQAANLAGTISALHDTVAASEGVS
jgi:hypothetical protein